MKKALFFGFLIILFALIFSGCEFFLYMDDCHDNYSDSYYDYAGIGVSVAANYLLTLNGFTRDVVYTGKNARQFLDIVSKNPAINSNDTYYKKRTYGQVLNWLNGFGLPSGILTKAKNSLTAYCYYDISGNLWAVFVEDVSYGYRSVMPHNNILENNIKPQEGFPQKEMRIE